MSQMKSEYRFGLGSVAAIAVVVMMIACPLIVAEDAFADASESVDIDSVADFNPSITEGKYKFDQDYKASSYTINQDLEIDGDNHTFYGQLKFDSTKGGDEGTYTVTIKNLTIDGNKEYGYGISSDGNQNSDTIRPVNLKLIDCKITNFSEKGLYMTNIQSLVLEGCTFENNAYRLIPESQEIMPSI